MKWLNNLLKKFQQPDPATIATVPLPPPHLPETEPLPINAEQESSIVKAERERLNKEIEILGKKKVRLQVECDRLEQEIEKNKYKTTELEHDIPPGQATTEKVIQQENQASDTSTVKIEAELEAQPPTQSKQIPHGSINAGDGMQGSVSYEEPNSHPFREYKRDKFFKIIWTWHYKDIDDEPHGITALCPECEQDVRMEREILIDEHGQNRELEFHCDIHERTYSVPSLDDPNEDPLVIIKVCIEQKIQNGLWVEVVNKQRRLKGLPLISVLPEQELPSLEKQSDQTPYIANISDFRVIKSTDDSVEIICSYIYNGDGNLENVCIAAEFIKPDGDTVIDGGLHRLAVKNKKAMLRFPFRIPSNTPPEGIQTTQVRLCMFQLDEEIYSNDFPYVKTWKRSA